MGQSGLPTHSLEVVREGLRRTYPPPLATPGVGSWLSAALHPRPAPPQPVRAHLGDDPEESQSVAPAFKAPGASAHTTPPPPSPQGDGGLGAPFRQHQGGDKETRAWFSQS